MPRYFNRNLSIGDPSTGIGLCLLWTPQERVLPRLDPSRYALAGNLYSRDGISFLLRNLLLEPTIRTLVLCGKDLTGSGAALIALWHAGLDAHHCIVGDGTQLHPEIPPEAIELVRRSVRLIDRRDTVRPEAIAALLADLPHDATPFAPAPSDFPYTEPQVETLPAESSGIVLHAPTIRAAYLRILWHVMTFGLRSATQHSSDQAELLNIMTVVAEEPTDPAHCSHAPWMPFTRASLGSQRTDGTFDGYLGQFLHAGHTESGLSYTYGDRLRHFHGTDQIATLIADLRQAPASRRAVATLWDPLADPTSPNPPCLTSVQARLRDQQLHLTAYVRSHDIYRAWAANAYGLRTLQGMVIAGLTAHHQVTAGTLTIVSHSAHVYAHDWQAARDLLSQHYQQTNTRSTRDPRGSFVITLDPPQIVVRHYTAQGAHLRTITGSTARELGRKLSPYISDTGHAIYLGQELQKAELALRFGWAATYQQDQELRTEN